MLDKKWILLSVTISVFCIVGVILGVHFLYGNKKIVVSDNAEHEIGTFTYDETEELPETGEEEATVAEELDSIAPAVNLIGYMDLPDIFTISVLYEMPQAIRDYLDEHGYADAFNLTIIEDSVVADRAYPMFRCEIEDTGHILEVRYEIAKKEFEFRIV